MRRACRSPSCLPFACGGGACGCAGRYSLALAVERHFAARGSGSASRFTSTGGEAAAAWPLPFPLSSMGRVAVGGWRRRGQAGFARSEEAEHHAPLRVQEAGHHVLEAHHHGGRAIRGGVGMAVRSIGRWRHERGGGLGGVHLRSGGNGTGQRGGNAHRRNRWRMRSSLRLRLWGSFGNSWGPVGRAAPGPASAVRAR